MQDLYPRKLASVASLPTASSTYDGATLRVGSKAYFCDGSTWIELTGREVLTADRTYYVSASGSDSNNGLGSDAYGLGTASYSGYSGPGGASAVSYAFNFTFNAAGTKLYESGSNGILYQYTLSTPWRISTASYDSKSFDPAQQSVTRGIKFSTDGTKLYIAGSSPEAVHQYTLSTAWDISTASYASKSLTLDSQTGIQGLTFSPDGTKLILCTFGDEALWSYTLSTAWDISTASYDSKSYTFTQDATMYGVDFSTDGKTCLAVGYGNDRVYEYRLSTAWDISTLAYTGTSLNIAGQLVDPIALVIRPGTNDFYLANGNVSTSRLFQYTISNPWPETPATNLPFLTIQKAIDTVAALDLSIYNVTIQVADGTYTSGVTLKKTVGSGTVTIRGNITTPANCLLSTGSAINFYALQLGGSKYHLEGFKLTNTSAGNACIWVEGAETYISFGVMDFGSTTGNHILALLGGAIRAKANYTISGGTSGNHIGAQSNAIVHVAGWTITLSGSPAFSDGFCSVKELGCLIAPGNTYSGSGTGVRYKVATNGVIRVDGGGANYFPGNSAGTTATGGQYN